MPRVVWWANFFNFSLRFLEGSPFSVFTYSRVRCSRHSVLPEESSSCETEVLFWSFKGFFQSKINNWIGWSILWLTEADSISRVPWSVTFYKSVDLRTLRVSMWLWPASWVSLFILYVTLFVYYLPRFFISGTFVYVIMKNIRSIQGIV